MTFFSPVRERGVYCFNASLLMFKRMNSAALGERLAAMKLRHGCDVAGACGERFSKQAAETEECERSNYRCKFYPFRD